MQNRYPQYKTAKKLLGLLRLYDPKKTGSMSSKNVFLRRFWRFFGLYPNMRFMPLYYEGANSFMAPKVYEYDNMLNGVQLDPTDAVLDVGCGEGTLSLAIGKSVKSIVVVDLSEESIANAKAKAEEVPNIAAHFYCQSLETLGFEHHQFDKVFSFSVIEHIPNYREVFEEIFDLLKDGGQLIISVDSFTHFDSELKSLHKKTFDVQKYFAINELEELLQELGFREVSVKPIFKSRFSERWFTRVMKDPGEYFGLFRRLYSILIYYRIRFHESRVTQNDHGIFLIAHCKK